LNQPKKPLFSSCFLALRLRMVAHRAGVSVSATNTESSIAETMVSENSR